jgi:hypothetical protein
MGLFCPNSTHRERVGYATDQRRLSPIPCLSDRKQRVAIAADHAIYVFGLASGACETKVVPVCRNTGR